MDVVAVSPGPQHMLALERANKVRLARAALKRKVAAGKMDAAEVVLSCPWEAESMSISELLMSQRRWGRTRCRKFLMSIGLLGGEAVVEPHRAPAHDARGAVDRQGPGCPRAGPPRARIAPEGERGKAGPAGPAFSM